MFESRFSQPYPTWAADSACLLSAFAWRIAEKSFFPGRCSCLSDRKCFRHRRRPYFPFRFAFPTCPAADACSLSQFREQTMENKLHSQSASLIRPERPAILEHARFISRSRWNPPLSGDMSSYDRGIASGNRKRGVFLSFRCFLGKRRINR